MPLPQDTSLQQKNNQTIEVDDSQSVFTLDDSLDESIDLLSDGRETQGTPLRLLEYPPDPGDGRDKKKDDTSDTAVTSTGEGLEIGETLATKKVSSTPEISGDQSIPITEGVKLKEDTVTPVESETVVDPKITTTSSGVSTDFKAPKTEVLPKVGSGTSSGMITSDPPVITDGDVDGGTVEQSIARLVSGAQAAKGAVQQSVSTSIAALKGESLKQKGRIGGIVAAQIASVMAIGKAGRAGLVAERNKLIGRVRGQANVTRNRIEGGRAKELARVDQVVALKKKDMEGAGNTAAQEASSIASRLARKATTGAASQNDTARRIGQAEKNKIAGGASAEERQAVNDAVDGVVNDFIIQNNEGARKLGDAARKEGREVAAGVRQRARDIAKSVGGKSYKIKDQINELADKGLEHTKALEDAAIGGIRAGTTGNIQQLNAAEKAAVARYQAHGDQSCALIDTKVAAAETSLLEIAKVYGEKIDATVEELKTTVASHDEPDPDSVSDAVNALLQRFGGEAKAIGDELSADVVSMGGGMSAAADAVETELVDSNTKFQTTVTALQTTFAAETKKSVDQAVAGLYHFGKDVVKGAVGVVDAYALSLDKSIGEVRNELTAEVKSGMVQAETKVDEGVAVGRGKLGELRGAVAKVHADVHEEFTAAWYERAWDMVAGALKAIIITACILVVAAIVAVALVLAGVSAALLATIAAVIAVVALVLVAAVSIYSRWQEYRATQGRSPSGWAAIGVVFAGIGDAVGVSQIIESFRGKRLCSDKYLSDEERGQLFADGVLALVTTITMVRGFTASKDIARVRSAVSAADDAAKLAAQGDDIAKVVSSSDDIAKAASGSDDMVKVARSADDIEGLSKNWKQLNPDEMVDLYRARSTKGKFTDAQIRTRHAEGWRLDASKKPVRWKKPKDLKLSTKTGGSVVKPPSPKVLAQLDDVASGSTELQGALSNVRGGKLGRMTKNFKRWLIKEEGWMKPVNAVANPQGALQSKVIRFSRFLEKQLSALRGVAAESGRLGDIKAIEDLAGSMNTICGSLWGNLLKEGNTLQSANETSSSADDVAYDIEID